MTIKDKLYSVNPAHGLHYYVVADSYTSALRIVNTRRPNCEIIRLELIPDEVVLTETNVNIK